MVEVAERSVALWGAPITTPPVGVPRFFVACCEVEMVDYDSPDPLPYEVVKKMPKAVRYKRVAMLGLHKCCECGMGINAPFDNMPWREDTIYRCAKCAGIKPVVPKEGKVYRFEYWYPESVK